MENRNWFVWRALAGVILVGLLAVGGFALHRLGWSQGFAAAEIAAEGGDVPTPPLAPAGWRPVGLGRGGLPVSLVVGLLLMAFAGRLVRGIFWGALVGPGMCGPGGWGSWRHARRWMPRSVPARHRPGYERPGGVSQGKDEA